MVALYMENVGMSPARCTNIRIEH